MNTQDILKKYQSIAEDYKWMAELNTETLKIQKKQLSQQAALNELKEFKPQKGWLQTLDAITLIDGSTPTISENDWIESGELINAKGDTVHIRPTKKNLLHWVEMCSNGDDEYFVTQISHQIKHKKTYGEATYQLYWESNNHTQTQAKFSRLVMLNIKESK